MKFREISSSLKCSKNVFYARRKGRNVCEWKWYSSLGSFLGVVEKKKNQTSLSQVNSFKEYVPSTTPEGSQKTNPSTKGEKGKSSQQVKPARKEALAPAATMNPEAAEFLPQTQTKAPGKQRPKKREWKGIGEAYGGFQFFPRRGSHS